VSEVLDRFLRYVRIDSASDPDVPARPSTPGQAAFADQLEKELAELEGPWESVRLADASLLVRVAPSAGREASLPAAFLAHLDTYYGLSGAAVPRVVLCDGKEIRLSSEVSIPARFLEGLSGKDLVVTDGNSLLGADDKAGVAALVTVLSALAKTDLPRGPVDFWFTTDEEIGRIGVEALPAGVGEAWKVLWTVDGEDLRDLSVGDLAIRRARLSFAGVDAHPCLHGQDLVPAHYAAARFVDRLADLPNPMTSSGRAPLLPGRVHRRPRGARRGLLPPGILRRGGPAGHGEAAIGAGGSFGRPLRGPLPRGILHRQRQFP
jgi:tripeptide aminopeptidase